jgi:predicted dehydrogenase
MHCEWVVKAAKAHKHILCEKPFAVNAREAETMVDAARANGVTLMEAFVYRCHPQTAKLIEILRRGVIGQVRVIQANYGFHCIYDAEGRLLNNSLGGGGILDMGCYPVSLTRLIAGVATGKDFADPIDLHACGHLGQTGVDEWTSAVCKFPGDIVAQWTTSVQCQLENGMRILGSEGRIHLPHAFHPAYWGGPSKIVVQFPGRTPQWDITVQADRPLFSIAIDAFAQHVREGQQQVTWPGIRWDDTIGNMRTTDRWRECIGLKYEADDATA